MLLGSILPGSLILAWWYGIRVGTAVVPTFGEVWEVLTHPFTPPEDLATRSLAFSFMMTMIRLSLGFGLGIITAIPLGFFAGRYRPVHRILNPLVQMARPINPIILLPIATVLFGLSSLGTVLYGGMEAWRHDILDQVQIAMIFILWWGAFFPVFLSALHGVRSVRRSHIEMMKLMGAGESQIFLKVILPHSLPYIANGMRVALGVTWLVLIAAEIFPGTRSGLGYMLCTACKTSDYQYTFSALIVIGIVGFLLDSLIAGIETRLSYWKTMER